MGGESFGRQRNQPNKKSCLKLTGVSQSLHQPSRQFVHCLVRLMGQAVNQIVGFAAFIDIWVGVNQCTVGHFFLNEQRVRYGDTPTHQRELYGRVGGVDRGVNLPCDGGVGPAFHPFSPFLTVVVGMDQRQLLELTCCRRPNID